MKLSRSVLMKVIWPERGSLFAIVGGAIGLSGDITSFFSEFLSPYYLLALFGVVALISALLCLQRASLAETSKTEVLDDVVRCGACDAMRFSLFSFAAFVLLLFIGQGQTATETMGEKLGLIHRDVQQIQQNVTAIRDEVGVVSGNVADIHSAIQSQTIIQNPQTADAFFANAWLYTYAQRDTNKALNVLEEMYDKFSPRKMDAAELYYNAARPNYGRADLIAKLVERGKASNDATLVVVAARYAADEEESQTLYDMAKEMDQNLPFAYWDIQRPAGSLSMSGIEPEVRKAIFEEKIAGMERFIALMENAPPSQYFFLPQYQADHEMTARQTVSSYQSMLETVNKTLELKAAQGRR
jgi:hypothetical protein